jgi:hypothetical protein
LTSARSATRPSLDFLQQAVGGYIEAVPGFDTIQQGDKVIPCVAFCGEQGKLASGKAHTGPKACPTITRRGVYKTASR